MVSSQGRTTDRIGLISFVFLGVMKEILADCECVIVSLDF